MRKEGAQGSESALRKMKTECNKKPQTDKLLGLEDGLSREGKGLALLLCCATF